MDQIIDVTQLSEWIGTPVPTLYRWRCTGTGPPSAKIGRSIVYRVKDVSAWLEDAFAKDAARKSQVSDVANLSASI
jgi:predicted DNA-binding transcriptional regulator AlpA